jgi:hypothetical protein
LKPFVRFSGVGSPNFSVAHASARPTGWHNSFMSAVNNANYFVDYVLSVDERFGEFRLPKDLGVDFNKVDLLMDYLNKTKRQCAVPNWINAINHTTGDVILVNSDDFVFPPNWTDGLAAVIGDRNPLTTPFVVHVSTGSPRDNELMTFQIFSRALINHWGYALWPEYESLYVDDDFTKHAYLDPAVEVIQARHLLFEHMHFGFGKSKIDAVYEHENRVESAMLGAKVYQRRLSENFA